MNQSFVARHDVQPRVATRRLVTTRLVTTNVQVAAPEGPRSTPIELKAVYESLQANRAQTR